VVNVLNGTRNAHFAAEAQVAKGKGPVKIAFVVHDYHRASGHSRYVVELATRFSEEHEVHVFANRIERTAGKRVIFHTVPALRSNVMTTLFSFAISSKLMVRNGFDVVHSQGFCGPRGNVITTHICNEAWSRSLTRFAGGQTMRERAFHFVASRLERRLYRDASGCQVIAISRRVAEDVREYYGCGGRIHLIYHGVDLQTFSPAVRRFREQHRYPLGLSDSDTVFIYVGDLRKGAAQCIRALSQVPLAHLVLVSSSPREPYEALASEAGVASRVHLLPPTNRVEEFYGIADALLLPTPYDAFAMVVTEAMACALPVIVSRAAGASELIQHGQNGLVLEDAANHVELAGYMKRLAADREWAARVGQAARRSAEQLSWDMVAQQTMQVYQEAVATRH
jgi:UDP-glucose:(heptosyl)LPS alpha-1,3-glucosyltransferase